MKKKSLGILYILCAAFFFALMNLFVRLAADVPVMQKCFFRNAVAAVVAAVTLLRSPEKFHMKQGSLPSLFFRSAAGTAGMICNFYAIGKMNISDASILNKLSPFFALIFSYFILKERANRVEWTALVLAFIGALFVVKPGLSMASVPAFCGVLGGMGAGLAYTFVRKLGIHGERNHMIVFFFSMFSCLVTLPYLMFAYTPMSGRQLLYLLLAGAAASGGQFSITAAYTHAPAREISVFDYTQVIFAAVLGFAFLGQIPDRYSIIGYGIIIGVAVWKWFYRENEKTV